MTVPELQRRSISAFLAEVHRIIPNCQQPLTRIGELITGLQNAEVDGDLIMILVNFRIERLIAHRPALRKLWEESLSTRDLAEPPPPRPIRPVCSHNRGNGGERKG